MTRLFILIFVLSFCNLYSHERIDDYEEEDYEYSYDDEDEFVVWMFIPQKN